MDRRYNQRITADLPVQLTLLETSQIATGRLFDLSESGIGITLRHAVDPGDMVKIEILGIVFYGQIAYSTPEAGGYRTGVYVEPALLDASNVVELVNTYLVTHVG
jgi:hypothetical protein